MAHIHLCYRDEIDDHSARSFYFNPARPTQGVILWRQGDDIAAFANSCPHLGPPLETFPHRLLNREKTHLVCSAHGALFTFSGYCSFGPCEHQSLISIDLIDGAQGALLIDDCDPGLKGLWPDQK